MRQNIPEPQKILDVDVSFELTNIR